MLRLSVKTRSITFSAFVLYALLAGGIVSCLVPKSAYASSTQSLYNWFLRTHYASDQQYDDNATSGPSQQQYDDRAYPNSSITYNQVIGSYNAFQSLPAGPSGLASSA